MYALKTHTTHSSFTAHACRAWSIGLQEDSSGVSCRGCCGARVWVSTCGCLASKVRMWQLKRDRQQDSDLGSVQPTDDGKYGSFKRFGSFGSAHVEETAPKQLRNGFSFNFSLLSYPNLAIMNGQCVGKQCFISCCCINKKNISIRALNEQLNHSKHQIKTGQSFNIMSS